MSRKTLVAPLAAVALTAGTLAAVPLTAAAAPDGGGLVISEVYGAGGNGGAVYNADFVELHNPTDAPLDLSGLALHYRSAGGGSGGSPYALTGEVPAHGYWLVQMSNTGVNGVALPTPDAVASPAFAMAAAGGQVALQEGTTVIATSGDTSGTPGIVDFVGASGAASFEGAPAGAATPAQSLNRDAAGTDTDSNADDFVLGSPSPGQPYEEPEPPEEHDLTIPEIQGTGAQSEYLGDIATTTGVVTAAYPAGGLFGFFLQTPGTGGPTDLAARTASDAVFVRMTQAAGAVTVEPGDHVDVTGTVAEFAGTTQLEVTAADDIAPVAEPADPVTPVTVAAWPRTAEERERLEGMLFRPTGDFTVANTYFGGGTPGDSRYGEVGLAQGDRPLITPTEVADAQDPEAVAAVVADNAARQIVLDDGSSWSFFGDGYDGGQTPAYVSQEQPAVVGATATFDEPVILTEGGSPSSPTWRFQPTAWVQGPDNAASPATFENPRTAAPDQAQLDPADTADLTVASFNVLNYFTTLGDADDDNVGDGGCQAYADRDGDGNNVRTGCDQRGAWDPHDLARQQEKIVAAINALDADVVGLMEIENSAALGETPDEATNALVTALNAAAGSEVWAANPSSADLPPVEQQDVITNAIIYKQERVERVGAAHALGDQSAEGEAFGNAREPIAQAFRPVAGGESFLVVVNHFKSKGSGVDDGTGQGDANPDRIRQAEALRDWVPTVQAEEGVEAVLLAGDFNAYTMEDPLQVLYAAGYVDAATELGGGEEWSYSFEGMSGTLDHVLLNEAALEVATGSDIWGINAGESILFEYSRWNYHATDFHQDTPYRSSDHDPVLVGLDLVAAPEPPRQQKAVIAAKFKPARLKVGKRGLLTVIVKGKQGARATGTVKVKALGKTVTATLKKNGKTNVKLPRAKRPGRLKVVVTYLGSDEVAAATKTFRVRVVRKR